MSGCVSFNSDVSDALLFILDKHELLQFLDPTAYTFRSELLLRFPRREVKTQRLVQMKISVV